MTNQKLYLAMTLAAVFLLIFALTAGILLTLDLSGEKTASIAEDDSAMPGPTARPGWAGREGAFLETPRDRFASDPEERFRAADEGWGGVTGRHGGADTYPPMEWQAGVPIGPGSAADARSPFEGYRFRPLEERERRRIERQRGDVDDRAFGGYRWPHEPFPDHALRPETPYWDGTRSETEIEPYRFRPVEPPRSTTHPWKGRAEPRAPGGYIDPRILEPIPQWGATPHELPPPLPYLYPSLAPEGDNRLSVR